MYADSCAGTVGRWSTDGTVDELNVIAGFIEDRFERQRGPGIVSLPVKNPSLRPFHNEFPVRRGTHCLNGHSAGGFDEQIAKERRNKSGWNRSSAAVGTLNAGSRY